VIVGHGDVGRYNNNWFAGCAGLGDLRVCAVCLLNMFDFPRTVLRSNFDGSLTCAGRKCMDGGQIKITRAEQSLKP
jgi:hypothetical protein